MSYNNTYYNDSSGTQDPNAEWYVQGSEYQMSGYTYHDAQQGPVHAGASHPAEAGHEDPLWPTYRGHFHENALESLDGLRPRRDRRYHCQDTQTGSGDCTESCENRSLLKKHLRVHVKPVVCPFMFSPITPQCDRRTAGQGDMKRHVLAHHRAWAKRKGLVDREHVCPHCGDGFTRSDNLTRHIRNTHR
ncbi:hypothetical protein MCOR07_005664 [Pyricularia oryzae]|nr:hypothetical protein MCOR13_006570 [Pyricularia oryzae]KAI6620064.1 hypothetical protein MCOR07_005664 [Pyricularia oryzae]